MEVASNLRAAFQDAQHALKALLADVGAMNAVTQITTLLAERFKAGSKVLICGNGGSLCDAAHFAEELTGRFRKDRPPLPAIACTDGGHLSCVANDYGYDEVFARWVRALGARGDVLIVLTTSGHSLNVRKAADAAREKGMHTVALLGKDGGELKGRCEIEIVAPGGTSDRIQEIHMLILHAVVEQVERVVFAK